MSREYKRCPRCGSIDTHPWESLEDKKTEKRICYDCALVFEVLKEEYIEE